MTRETKIGLLVGLAFIIVIGILLSDHLSATEPPQAMIAGVGDSVRNGATVPGSAAQSLPMIAVNPTPTPRSTVPTHVEISPQQPGNSVVEVHAPVQPALNIHQTSNTQDQVASNTSNDPMTTQTPTGNVPAPLVNMGHPHDTDLVAVNGADSNVQNNPPAHPAGTREYKAIAGDTVSKMAANFLGSSTKTTREQIINANASLKSNPDKIVVGRTYLIPVVNQPAAASTSAGAPAVALVTPTTRPAVASRQSIRTYTVRDGDTSLWKIAARELGNGGDWQQIADLNRDVLKGTTKIQAGMTLKLPAKTVAMAR